MPKVGTIYKYLLACPDDVSDKLPIIEEAVKQFNRTIGESNNIIIQIKHWLTDSYPELGAEPQEIINRQVVDGCDGAIALFWTKFGSPTSSYQSGTEEEIERMVREGKQVFIYFLDIPVALSNVDLCQYNKVKDFKERYKNRGMYSIVTDESDLKTKLFNHLSLYFLNEINTQNNNIVTNEIQLGVMALNSGDIDRSITHFENAIILNPNDIGAYLGLVRVTFGEQSIPYCSKLKLFPKEDVKKYLIDCPEMMADGENALLSRVIYNTRSLDLVRVVLEAGADPNSKQALYYAMAVLNNLEMVQLLLEFGADANWVYTWTNQRESEIRSALAVAIWELNNLDIVKALIKYGADIDYMVTNSHNESWSVLDMAVRLNNIPIVKYLLEHGADVNNNHIYYWDGLYSPVNILSDAIRYTCNPEMVQLLIDFEADPNYTYSYRAKGIRYEKHICEGSSLSDAIIYSKNNKVLKLLLDNGVNPSTIFKHKCYGEGGDDCEVPVLDIAVHNENTEAIKLLINAGASFDDMCIVGTQRFPIKYRDYAAGNAAESLIRKYGWTGSNIFKGQYISYYYVIS